jgi:DNA-directed RNA polymerase II subunit RPB1
MPGLSHSSETESIVGIQFGVFSPDEIVRRSVVEVTTHSTQEGKIGGLADPRMGVLENGKLCRSCGQNNHGCPGHFGHYRLARPVYHIQFYKMILKILRCTCIKCAKLLINKEKAKNLRRLKGENRWKAVLTACQEVTRCGEQTEDGCGARQPHRYHDEDICRIVAEWKDLPQTVEAGAEAPPTKMRRFLEPEYVHRLLRRVSDEDVDFMGFSRMWCRPDWLMCSVLTVPPPQVRPSVLQDNNQRSEDDLTQKLIDIIKTNATLNDKIAAGAKKKAIDEWTLLLQYHVATLVNNDIPGVAQSAQRSGRPLKSLQQRLGTKEGRIRNNLQGKRVEFSARSVITPDPNISVEELGVPMKIAMNLTFPERVTAFNIDRLYALIQNGPENYPGAKSIQRASADGQPSRMISLKLVRDKSLQLYEGDVVNRHLLDGDPVLFNRQPSLHRMSMMCHRVRVLPYSTFRLNVSVTKPYNADFDGDEMNMHVPQSVEAATELREIAAVPKQLISPKLSKPLISIVQDTLVGVNRLTRPTEFFNRREFMNLLVHSKRWDGRVPPPAKTDPVPLWSGQQVVSCLLPAVHIAMGNKMWDKKDSKVGNDNYVIINNGVLEQGILDGDIFDKALIHILYNDFNPEMTVDFIDSLQAVVATYLQNSGFSVGISDIIADADTLSGIAAESEKLKANLESLQLQVHMGLFDNTSGRTNQDEFESKVFQNLDKVVGEAGKMGLKSLARNNRMVNMVKCGSKGSDTNIAQMIALLGQQAIEGRRIAYGFQDRTLPHFKRYDDGADARGYIESSFVKGLNPAEFFFHAMTGREGLIDTAVKTADSGYMQRKLIKTMEDLLTYHDGSVRDAGGVMVQFAYGGDGTSATKIENQPIRLAEMADGEIRGRFTVDDVAAERSQTFLTQIMADRDLLVNNVFGGRVANTVQSAVHLPRMIANAIQQLGLEAGKGEPVAGGHVLDTIERIQRSTRPDNRLWGALLRYNLTPRDLKAQGFTRAAFDWLAEQIVLKHMRSWVVPGEMSGIIAAQSLGETTTQMTLNTFHLAGVAAKSGMTRGVPRLKELLQVTQNPRATSLTIALRPDIRNSKEEARRLAQELEFTMLKDLVTTSRVYYDPRDSASLIAEDKEWLSFFAQFEQDTEYDELAAKGVAEDGGDPAELRNPWIIRLELDREKMFNKNITMEDINYVLRKSYGDISLAYTDHNASRMILRARPPAPARKGPGQLDGLAYIKQMQNMILTRSLVRGLPGLRSVSFRKLTGDDEVYQRNPAADGKYEPVQQFVLDTFGTNFIDTIIHPDVDGNRVISNHVHDIFETLGIEAARTILFKEIFSLFEQAAPVNYRHVSILVDAMCTRGRMMSADRIGVNRKQKVGALAKASFEQTEDIMIRAALFGEMDPVTGVSANIMTGQPIRGGTSFTQVLLDEAAFQEFMKTAPPPRRSLERAPALVQAEIDRMLDTKQAPGCRTEDLRIPAALPPMDPMVQVGAELPEMEIVLVDE